METEEKDDSYVGEEEEGEASVEFSYLQHHPKYADSDASTASSSASSDNNRLGKITVSMLSEYAVSEYPSHRQLAANNILECLKLAVQTIEACSEQDDVIKVIDAIKKLSQDLDAAVKCSLLKSLPKVINFCSWYDTVFASLRPLILAEFLPIVLKAIADENVPDISKVRREAYNILKYMLAENHVTMTDIEEKVFKVYRSILESQSNTFDNVSAAGTFLVRMAPIVGEMFTENTIVPEIMKLCSSYDADDREVCVYFIVDLTCFLHPVTIDNIIVPKFVDLCLDIVFHVRKICAKTIVTLACMCSLDTRRTVLTPAFIELLYDFNDNVKCCAYQQLGAFITTFSQPMLTSLANNFNGEMLLIHNDFVFQLHSLKELRRIRYMISLWGGDGTRTTNISTSVYNGSTQYGYLGNEEEANDNGGEIEDEENKEFYERERVLLIKNFENQPDLVQSCIYKGTKPNVTTAAEMQHCLLDEYRKMATSREETILPSNDYNSFLYWREPFPEFSRDDFCTITNSTGIYHSIRMEDNVEKTEDIVNDNGNEEFSSTNRNYSNPSKIVSDSDIVRRKARSHDFEKDSESTDMKFGRESMTLTSRNGRRRRTNRYIDLKSFKSQKKENDTSQSLEDEFDEFDENIITQPLANEFADSDENIIPQQLLLKFMSMADSDNREIRKYCAYVFPAVLLTVGASKWHHLKIVFSTLADDKEWRLKKISASSISEIAKIIGPDLATSDLVPIYNLLISDLPDVRITALEHFSEFLKCLKPFGRDLFLPYLMKFTITDNALNWRFKENWSDQLTEIVEYYTASDCYKYICPVAFNLLTDKVAAVRLKALNLMSTLVRIVSADMNLLRNTITELAEQFAHSTQWNRRQTFIFLCSSLLVQSALPADKFARDILPHLLDLGWDVVPNIRIALARTLTSDIISHPYFDNSKHSPHHDVLMQVLRRLKSDTDRDVRHFASCIPLSSRFITLEEEEPNLYYYSK